MLKRVLLLIALLACAATAAAQTPNWTEGKNYFRIEPAQPTSTPGKVEVVEVFSFGCPACNHFRPIVNRLKATLPANAQLVYVPASFNPSEDWPLFQRTFFTMQALGIEDKAHEAMYQAVWENGPLATVDANNRLRNPQPSLDDVAQFFSAKFGIKPDDFAATANSFAVNAKMKRADAYVKATGVDQTPTFIVNGKYRVTAQSAGSIDQLISLIDWLVARESGAQP